MSELNDLVVDWIKKNDTFLFGEGHSFKTAARLCSLTIHQKVTTRRMTNACGQLNGLWNGKARKIPTNERSLNEEQWSRVLAYARSLKLRPDETPESLARRMHKKVGTTVTVPMAEEALKLIRSNDERKWNKKALLETGA